MLMRTTFRALLLALGAVSIATGCISWSEPSEDDGAGSPTPMCTPPTANDVDVSLLVADADAFAGRPALARFVSGTQVFSCTSAMVPAGGDFEITLGGFGPGGATVELVLSSDGDSAHTSGDFTQGFLLDVDGTVTPDAPCSVHETWDLAFSVTGASSEAVTWSTGIGCPGSS